jgi:hypothetical protein
MTGDVLGLPTGTRPEESTLPHVRVKSGAALHSLRGSFGYVQRALEPSLGTISPNPWIADEGIALDLRMIPAPISPDSEVVLVVVPSRPRSADVSFVDWLDKVRETSTPAGEGPAALAWSIRSMSGLSASALSKVFPVARETYQRWISGTARPSEENLRRLHQLSAFILVASRISSDPRTLLLMPITSNADGETIYDWLCQGRLTEAWQVLGHMARREPYSPFDDADGNRGVRVSGITRVGLDETPEEEYDDFS